MPFTAKERQVLIRWWAGEVREELQRPEFDKLWISCLQKTGCLMKADGTDDHLIKPEGNTQLLHSTPTFTRSYGPTSSKQQPPC